VTGGPFAAFRRIPLRGGLRSGVLIHKVVKGLCPEWTKMPQWTPEEDQ
jgi:hypothetical protein